MANYADITNVTPAWQVAPAVNENVIWTTIECPIFIYPSNTHPDTVNTQGILLAPGERFLVSSGLPVYYKAAAGDEFCITRVAADRTSSPDMNGPALSAFAITPSDSTDLPAPVRAVTIGTAGGTIRYTQARTGAVCTTGPLPVGSYSIWARRIWATGTTATGLTGWE